MSRFGSAYYAANGLLLAAYGGARLLHAGNGKPPEYSMMGETSFGSWVRCAAAIGSP
jgi:hypothetical protein